MPKLRLMSNNQWKNDENLWEELGLDCSAATRARGFAEAYAELAPDVVGLQEVSGKMIEELMERLAEKATPFALLWGRDTPILYRSDKFELLDSRHALYPDGVPGLDGIYNNKKTKSYTIAHFRCKEDGKRFVFVSTHLWWKSSNPESRSYYPGSDEARAYQIELVIAEIDRFCREQSCPVVIVGDFNTRYDSKVIEYAKSRGFSHAHDVATEYADETNGHHPCGKSGYMPYEPKPFVCGIDHILVRDCPSDFVRRFDRYYPDSFLPLSDHFPLYIDVEF